MILVLKANSDANKTNPVYVGYIIRDAFYHVLHGFGWSNQGKKVRVIDGEYFGALWGLSWTNNNHVKKIWLEVDCQQVAQVLNDVRYPNDEIEKKYKKHYKQNINGEDVLLTYVPRTANVATDVYVHYAVAVMKANVNFTPEINDIENLKAAEIKVRCKAEAKARRKLEAKIEARRKTKGYVNLKELQSSITALYNRLCYEKLAPLSYLNAKELLV
ncbi:hypothetical protein QJS04_geneDACA000990 [Acorus gramineus]|uniref:RNase H type-1 domain-containing protein n=1 Tax=Acorus gramineus TaxID=55184 RepID=A0AAV9ACF7_ACOGR|nr:hypothetical protein QJS04_geneDACA000990 [Acorus gramineus]